LRKNDFKRDGAKRETAEELVAAIESAGAVPLHEFDPPSWWALMLGAEGRGLTDGALAQAHDHVRIPMARGVDSLNVATAAAVAFAHLS
jgi:tRNA G18 (ribose-2'-O)-methylase SpoU